MTSDAPLPSWTKDHSRALLGADPLPSTFHWPHRDGRERPVVPDHKTLRGGYGKWLSETPYYPGLFELIDDLLVDFNTTDAAKPDTCSWIVSHELKNDHTRPVSWGEILALELKALRLKHSRQVNPSEPLAHELRRLRTRPGGPSELPL